MEAKLCIYICNSLVPEVNHLLQDGNYYDVTLKSFPAVCTGKPLNNSRIMEMVADQIDHFSKIIIFVSSCRSKEKESTQIHHKIEIIRLEQCLELFFSLPTIYHYIKQGNYIVSNGWLKNYKHHIREWGFDEESAKSFFGESLKKILLLETGLPSNYLPELEALSKYMGLPYDILPIGNSHLQKNVETLILKWRSEHERKTLNEKIANVTSESADYTLIFYHLQKLIDKTEEAFIVNEIFELIDLLFAPEQIIYQQLKESNQTIRYYKPNNSDFKFDLKNSFEVEIKHIEEPIGVFGIIGIKFPEYISKYKLMTTVISQMGGLAISNARKYSKLEQARLEILRSEKQFHSLFDNMNEGVALHQIEFQDGNPIDYRIIDINERFGEILGVKRTDVIGKLSTLVYHADEAPYLKEFNNVVFKNKPFYFETYYASMDKHFAISVVPWQAQGFATIFTDITERKKADVSLRKLSQAVEQSPVSVLITDTKGNIEYGNPIVSLITGYTSDEFSGKNPRLFSAGEKPKEEYEELWETITSGDKWKGEFHNKKKNGELYWESSLITSIKNSEGKIIHYLAIKEDITARKEAALKIAENSQKFKNLSQSATIMLNLKSVDEVFDYLISSLHQQYPNSIILLNKINKENDSTTLIKIEGISKSVLAGVKKLLGINILNQQFKLTPNHYELFKSGDFHFFEKGLVEFAGPEFPKLAVQTIEKLLNINQIYTIGITQDNNLFAAIHFFNRSNKQIVDNEYIETFIRQAGIVIEQKYAEEQLQISEEKYRLLTENASDVIWILNLAKKRFTYVSPAIKQLRGLTPEDAMAEKMQDSLTQESYAMILKELRNNLSKYISNSEDAEFYMMQVQQPCKDGSIIWVEVSTKFRYNIDGEIEVVGVSRNIEKRKRLENELREINSTKDKFFSVISHDLRSPFASVISLLGLLVDNIHDYSLDEVKKFTQSALKTSQSAYQLLENLLEWSRLQRGAFPFNPETIILQDFLKTCDPSTMEMAHTKHIVVNFDFPDNLKLSADPIMLHSIIRNLVTNAIKFTNTGGEILVTARLYQDNMVLISISDNGIGIDQVRLNNLFQVGINVSRPGTDEEPSSGLGLILCKEFIEKHKGKIWVESEVGKGSTFYFTIEGN